MRTSIIILILGAFFATGSIYAQEKTKRIQIKRTTKGIRIDEDGTDLFKLIGDVWVQHGDVMMYCDSAYVNKEKNLLDAYNNIRILQGDSMVLTGDTLYYDGNTELARLRGNIKMEDPDMILTTQYLDYNMATETAVYYSGGTITSKKDDNVLVSQKGYYHSNTKSFFFKDSVRLTNEDYVIESDTMKYNTESEITWFFGPTTITSDSNLIYCENGWYDTKRNLSEFRDNAYIQTKEQTMKGDSLVYDREKSIGEVFGNVSLLDTVQDFLIKGDYAIHYQRDSISMVTGHAELIQILEEDSLHIHGDTLIAGYDSTGEHRTMQAYYHVKFFKPDLQGMCDSLHYSTLDSTFYMFGRPILWSDENQITADSIHIIQGKEGLDRMYMDRNAFIISKDDTLQYNQIKGKDMIGYFKESKLRKVDVIGNGQTIYYARENDTTLLGVNKAICSNLRILIDSNTIQDIFFLNKPEATMTPEHKIIPSEMILDDFLWQVEHRPTSPEEIFEWNRVPALPEEDPEATAPEDGYEDLTEDAEEEIPAEKGAKKKKSEKGKKPSESLEEKNEPEAKTKP